MSYDIMNEYGDDSYLFFINIYERGYRFYDCNGGMSMTFNHNLNSNNIPFKDTMQIDGRIYQNVYVYTEDTVDRKNTEIWKVIIAENYGVVKYYNKKTGKEWTLRTD